MKNGERTATTILICIAIIVGIICIIMILKEYKQIDYIEDEIKKVNNRFELTEIIEYEELNNLSDDELERDEELYDKEIIADSIGEIDDEELE